MPLDQKILALSEAFQKARTEGTGLADLQALLGRGGAELIPLLSASREEIEKLFASVNVVSDDSVQRLAAMNDEFDLLVMNAKAFAAEVIVANVGLAKIAGRLLKGEAFGNILTDMGNEGLDADIERAAKERGRKKAAEALKQAEAEKAAAAAAKERQKAEEKITEQRRNNARMRADISQGELDVLPDEQKFQALQDKLRELFIDAQHQLRQEHPAHARRTQETGRRAAHGRQLPWRGRDPGAAEGSAAHASRAGPALGEDARERGAAPLPMPQRRRRGTRRRTSLFPRCRSIARRAASQVR